MSTKHKRRIKYLTFTLAPAILIALLAAVVTTMSTGSTTASALESPPCNTCHNNTSLITGKEAQWKESGHGTGTAFIAEGPNKSCAGCHSGGGFSDRIAAGLQPNQVTVGDPNPTPQDCRACHQIHNTYTGVDWALETIAPVSLYAITNKTFDGGEGNLCASCHQPRSRLLWALTALSLVSPTATVPHHGPQSSTAARYRRRRLRVKAPRGRTISMCRIPASAATWVRTKTTRTSRRRPARAACDTAGHQAPRTSTSMACRPQSRPSTISSRDFWSAPVCLDAPRMQRESRAAHADRHSQLRG